MNTDIFSSFCYPPQIFASPFSYPALWPEALCIAAVGKSGNLPVAYFSNTNPEVDYSGIGVDVISFRPGGGTQDMSGKY